MNDGFGFQSQFDPVVGSLLVLLGRSCLGQMCRWSLRWMVILSLPVNETSGCDVEMTVEFSMHCVFLVDWGLFVPAACLSAALFSGPLAFVVATFLSLSKVVASPWILLSAMDVVSVFLGHVGFQTLRVLWEPRLWGPR